MTRDTLTGARTMTPYQRIVRAGKRGTGCRLTSDDVQALMLDDAIVFRAELDDHNDSGLPDEDVCPSREWPTRTERYQR